MGLSIQRSAKLCKCTFHSCPHTHAILHLPPLDKIARGGLCRSSKTQKTSSCVNGIIGDSDILGTSTRHGCIMKKYLPFRRQHGISLKDMERKNESTFFGSQAARNALHSHIDNENSLIGCRTSLIETAHVLKNPINIGV